MVYHDPCGLMSDDQENCYVEKGNEKYQPKFAGWIFVRRHVGEDSF